MANNILLRILVAARPGIQAGKLKMQDIVSEYFRQTGGKTIDPGERTIIENEFIEFAPSNVTTPEVFKGFLKDRGEIVDQASTIPGETENVRFGSNIDYDAFAKQFNLNVEDIRGKNYQEIMEIAKSQNEGIGSMIPKEYYGYNTEKARQVVSILSKDQIDDAFKVISNWKGYSPTPLEQLNKLSSELGLKSIFYKTEKWKNRNFHLF